MDWLRTKMVIVLLGVQYLSQDFWLLRQTPHLFWLGVQGKFLFPIIPETRFIQHGDILIGVLEAMTHRKSSVSRNETYCSDRTFLKGYGEAVAYAVEKVNKQQLLPHNLTLGYAILNSCDSRTVTAAQSVSFLPYTKCSSEENKTTYDVVAVLGATTSGQTIAATHILERGQVPMISVFATSDELVSIERFPYFLRVVPPDKYQFKAITKLIKTFAWTYVSVIYADSSYGLNAFQLLRNYFEENEICLAVARMLPKRSDEEAISIAKALVKQHARSPVAVMIMSVILLQKVVTLTQRFLPNKTFVWIGTDAWSRYATSLGDDNNLLLDSLLVDIPNADISSFNDWFIKRRPGKMSDPWFQTLWENQFNCSLDHGTCNVNETEVKKLLSTLETRVPHIIDAISMIANATSRVLRSWDCRSITRSTARKCVTGPRLLRELHATKQSGYTGEMELDSNGDRFGRYEVNQLRAISSSRYEIVTVYTYESASDKLMSVSKVAICLALMPLHLDWHTMYQPNSELPHVVSSCVLPRAGLLSFLFYNLIFLVLSALLTSRTHVENRERNLILTCSTITLIMWVCFSPAYTVAESHIIRMLILALFLFISHFVAIGSFFLPTVYVVWQEQRKVDAVKEELTMLKSQE
ncbi:hypothetical protein ACOMHN_036945 [Nucella lapillus]